MQQFRPFPSFQDQIDDTAPLRADNPDKNTQPELDALSLLTALQSTMTTNTPGRIVVIPGGKKRDKTNKIDTSMKRRMNPRLRLGLVCGIMLVVLGYTLFSLSPLAAGQGSFPGLSAVGNWVRQQATNLAFDAHMASIPQQQQQPTTTTQG